MMSKMPEDADIAVDTTYTSVIDSDNEFDDAASYTSGQSLASSITRYRYENGRRYHAYREGSYYGPNDDKYSSYEAIVHHLWLLTLKDDLYLAPIMKGREDSKGEGMRILDIGTGTGLWAVDMADHLPNAQITATDLSPNFYTTSCPNIHWDIDDANNEWTYPPSYFDFVHIRGLTGCITSWPDLYAQVYRSLKPGGHFEHLEFSILTNADPQSDNHADQMYTAFSMSILEMGDLYTGKTFYTFDRMRGYMESAGFVDVVERTFTWPVGAWPKDAHLKEVGRWGLRNWMEGLEAWILFLYTKYKKWSFEQVQDFIRDFKSVIKDRKNHYYHEVKCVYGRKPFPHEVPASAEEQQTTQTG